jgi:GABA permease
MTARASVLVVANRTADSPELIAALRQRAERQPARFTLLVPAVPRGLAWAADMKAGAGDAIARAEGSLRRLRLAGLDLTGAIVGDPDPFAAVGDALHSGEFDEVIVSTLPRGASRWLGLSLPDRLRRATDLPVAHVVAAHAGGTRRIRRQRQPAALTH